VETLGVVVDMEELGRGSLGVVCLGGNGRSGGGEAGKGNHDGGDGVHLAGWLNACLVKERNFVQW